MAQIKVKNIQSRVVFNVEINPDDVGHEVVIDVPPGFILLNVANVIRTAFNGGTPTFSIVDNKSSPTTLIASASSATAGNSEVTSAARYSEYPNGGKLRILYVVASGAATAGRADVLVEGIVRGRQNENFGSNIAT